MISRRQWILSTPALGGMVSSGLLLQSNTVAAKASQPTTAINFELPQGSCDCHTHIHGDPALFPMFSGRTYTPEAASPAEMTALHKALGIDRVIIVTPSIYGPDNSATIAGLKVRGKNARAVAVINDKTTDGEIDQLVSLGFKGIRLNLVTNGVVDPQIIRAQFLSAAERVKKWGWHIQINTTLNIVSALKEAFLNSPVPLVFDHFAGTDEELDVKQSGFSDLVDLVKSGKTFVKISVTAGPRKNYSLFKPFAQALIGANVDRILWGTNWPHPNSTKMPNNTDVSPLWPVDDGLVLNQLPSWAPEASVRKKILVDNPEKLYGF